MKLRTTILFVLIITVMLSAGFFASEVLAQGCTDSAGQPVECPSSDDDGEDKNDDDADPATVFRFLSINENYLDPSNWNNNGSLPGPGQNARLDGQRAIIDPNSPEVIPLGSLILRNNANLTIRDARLEFETLDSVNSGIEVYNSYIKAKTFIDPGGGGILFNPSFLEADRIILYKAETPIRFGLGGETPTDPSALGLGHYARMQGRAVDLDGQLGIFTVYGFHPEPGQEFEIISVSGANHVNGTFANAPEGAIIDGFCDVQLRISYMGGDGNDVVLTAEERTTPDPKCAENFDNPSSEKNVFLDGAEIDISP
ncbi:MAG: hypothetical protein GY755_10730, partial [Chloroflexi bacterium]|nr:hypothetical protein [Chloroflexota bacterium]